MLAAMIEAYLRFVNSGAGGITTIVVSGLICTIVVIWAWRSRRIDRLALVIASGLLTLLVLVGYLAAARLKWWHGIFIDDVPLVMQVSTLMPTALLGWLAWLGGYRWLATRAKSPRLIFVAVGTWLVLAAAVADRIELSQGLIEVGDGNVWVGAAIMLALMFVPLLLVDAVEHALSRELLP